MKSKPSSSPKPQDARGKENAATMPRIEKVLALFKRQQDYPPGKSFVTLKQLIELVSGKNPKDKISESTMRRVLDAMRDYFNLPIDYIPARKGHGFTQPVSSFSLDVICEEQVYLLIQSVQMLSMYREKNVYQQMRKLVKKSCLGNTMMLGFEFEEIEEALSFHVVGFDAPAPVDPELFKAAMRAILNRQEVTLEHRSVKRPGEVTKKTVEPLHLSMINHALYFWHWDEEAEVLPEQNEEDAKIRKFALTRISHLTPTRRKCKPRPFDVHARVKRGMGAYDEKSGEPVEIRFTPKIAPLILERRWHEAQTVTKHADGGLTLSLPVGHTPELDGFIMRWAGNVEVIGPVGVRQKIRELGEALVKAHSDNVSIGAGEALLAS